MNMKAEYLHESYHIKGHNGYFQAQEGNMNEPGHTHTHRVLDEWHKLKVSYIYTTRVTCVSYHELKDAR